MDGGKPRSSFGRGRSRARSPSLTRRGPLSPDRATLATNTDSPSSSGHTSSISSVSTAIDSLSISAVVEAGGTGGEGGTGAPRGSKRGAKPEAAYLVTKPKDTDKRGKKGASIPMQANYFAVKSAPAWSLYQYRVDFSPEEDRTGPRKKMFRLVATPLKFGYMFDGTVLYSSKCMEELKEGPLEFTVTPEARDGSPPVTTTITVKLVGKVDTGSPAYVQVYNLLLRKCLFTLELEEMGRNFFDPKAAIKLPAQRLELWPGYVTSMRNHEQSVLLCVEVTHKVLRLDNVLMLIRAIEKSGNYGANKSALAAAVRSDLNDTIVMTTYNRKTYHVDDVDFDVTPKSTFEFKGEQISYADYYKARYGIEISDLNQPLIISRPTKRDMHRGMTGNAFLIPELCQSTGLTDAMRANFQLMKELGKHLHQGPQERVQAILRFMQRIKNNPILQQEFSNWGLELDSNLVSLPGRILPKEQMLFANGKNHPVDDKGDFTMAFRSQQMLSAVGLNNWVILVPQRDAQGVDNLVRTMTKVATPLNMNIANPKQIIKLPDPKIQTYLRNLEDVVKRYPDLQMLFVILPTNKLDLYAAVKKRLAVDVGVPSQCFLGKNVGSKGLMSIATKVVVQMNAKLGGEPWSIKLPMKNTMFVGFDVYHGAKGTKGGSIGAMVATISPNFTKYFSTTSTYKSADELSKTMRVDILKCVHAYEDANGDLPEKIFMYRDGVGEGQLSEVYTVELHTIVEALEEAYKAANRLAPKLVLIVVSKKINTRVFLNKGGRLDNPLPGTVVDDVVTLPERYDFFLISAGARQGTVSPCSYNVIHDTSGLEADRIHMITYKLCHMYFNWSGTIAVPAPCQYAHKLAFLTGMAYAGHANPRLSRLLHFL